MKKSLVTLGLMAIVNLFAIGTANAALLLDQSPDSTLGVLSFDATNIDTRQTFATRLTLAEPTQITGMSVFSNHHGGLGNPVVFKIFEDVSSMPASVLFSVTEALDSIDLQFTTTQSLTRSHMTLSTPITLGTGTYWFGMAGQSLELGQAFLNLEFGAQSWIFVADSALGPVSDVIALQGDMAALQIEGTAVVPIPAPAWLLGSAIGGLGLMRRRFT